MSENMEPSRVAHMLNGFLSRMTDVIFEHEGTLDKFIGDCVMAHFQEGEIDNALKAALQIQETLAAVRGKAASDAPERMLYAGIGIEYGEVIQGNVGSTIKMDYTVLGSVVNRAQGLERLTRVLPAGLIFSEDVKKAAGSEWKYVNLGKHPVKGREEPVDLYTLDNPNVYPLEIVA